MSLAGEVRANYGSPDLFSDKSAKAFLNCFQAGLLVAGLAITSSCNCRGPQHEVGGMANSRFAC